MTDAPSNPTEFERAFAAADTSTRTAFVADLWEALGWKTSIEGRVVVAERSDPTPETRRLLVSTGERPPDETDVDVLVTPSGSVPSETTLPVIDAADIHSRALYGADRSATAQVVRRHFEIELFEDPPGGTNDATQDDGSEDDGSPEESGEASGPNPMTAGRTAGLLFVVVLGIACVGFAAGTGLVVTEVALEDRPAEIGTDATATPDRDAVPNGSAARYASLRPTCERPPELVITIQVSAFARNDELDGDAGIRTAYRFASPENREVTGPQASFTRLIKQQYAIMLRHESVEYGDVQFREGSGENSSRTMTQRVTLTDENGTETAFMWSVAKQEGGEYDGCWMTSSVRRVLDGGA